MFWQYIGAFLSGVGSVVGAAWVIRAVVLHEQKVSDTRLNTFKEGLTYGATLTKYGGPAMETENPERPHIFDQDEEDDDKTSIQPRPEPKEEPSDPHLPDLDDPEDRIHLRPDDPRRGPEAA